MCDVTRGQRIKTTNLTSRLALLLLLSTDPLLLGPLGTTLLLQDDRKHRVKHRWGVWDSLCIKASLDLAENSQSCPWGRSAPPPPSSCTQSGHRWGPAAQPGPCSDVSSGCPAGHMHRKQQISPTETLDVSRNPLRGRFRSAYIKVHFLTIRDLGSAGPTGDSVWCWVVLIIVFSFMFSLSLFFFFLFCQMSQMECERKSVRRKLTWTLASPLQVRKWRGDKYMSSG